MAIKYQFNKTSLQQLNKELKVRVNALPTLQAKEAALRLEVKKAKAEFEVIDEDLQRKMTSLESTYRLWREFPKILAIENVTTETKAIAGVKMPVLQEIIFKQDEFSYTAAPSWFPAGISILKEIMELRLKKIFAERKLFILDYARKKTTQKVNLYEKVQIPGYNEAILKIKRFLEDADNLAKSSQKILKTRLEEGDAA